MVRALLSALFAFGLVYLSHGGQLSVPGFRIPKPPVIDGVIHENDEWKDVPSVSGLIDTSTNEKAPDAAKFWLAYDDHYVYLAARLSDSQPRQIRALQYQTNAGLEGDDYIEFDLDLSGSTRDFNSFQVNPKGATNTLLAGGRAAKREWAGEFEAAARINDTGWEVELRIPWRAMKLPAEGVRDVRFNFTRFVARTTRDFGLVYRTIGNSANLPIWRNVAIPRSPADHSVKLLPYGYAGFDPAIGSVLNSGLDVKTQLGDRAQLVGSINPDFRNIENQILNLDFSHFARLAGESRPFFLEGQSYISTNLFASQVIPRFDVGVNSYGKINDRASFGVLDTTRFGNENDFVATTSYVFDTTSSGRVSVTDASGSGVRNEAFSAGYRKGFGPVALSAAHSESFDGDAGFGSSSRLQAVYAANGLFAFGSYQRVSPNYLPKLAFLPEVNYAGYRGSASYDREWNHGALSILGGGISYLVYDHATGGDYRRDASYSVSGAFRNGISLSGDVDVDQFEGSNDHLTSISLGYPFGDPNNNINTSYTWGQETGLDYETLSANISRRLLPRLQISARYQVVNYAGVNDQAIFDVNLDLRKDSAIYGRLVEQGGNINAFLAFRRSGNLGAEYFLIVGDPNAPRFRNSIILKVSFPFEIGGSSRR